MFCTIIAVINKFKAVTEIPVSHDNYIRVIIHLILQRDDANACFYDTSHLFAAYYGEYSMLS